jgi:nucleoside phosphorylase
MAIFAALRWECRPILRHLRQVRRQRRGGFVVWKGATASQEVWLVKTGVGMQPDEDAATALGAQCAFDLFLSTGCAGALARELRPGDLAIATAVVGEADGSRFPTDVGLLNRARSAAARAQLGAAVGPVLCIRNVLATIPAKQAAAAGGAIAVAMEGSGIAACAAQRGIPFASIRAILDTADTELVDAGRFIEPQTGSIKPLALAGYLAGRPAALARLIALQRMASAAQTSLERFFGAWLNEHC